MRFHETIYNRKKISNNEIIDIPTLFQKRPRINISNSDINGIIILSFFPDPLDDRRNDRFFRNTFVWLAEPLRKIAMNILHKISENDLKNEQQTIKHSEKDGENLKTKNF